MVKRARYLLIAVLSVSILAGIAGIVRTFNAGPLHEFDAYSIWNVLELHLGMVTASLPALKPISKRLFETTS